MILAVVQQQQIKVPENSWIGNTTMGGVGLILFLVSFMCIKGSKKNKDEEGQPMGPWGPFFGLLMQKVVGEPTKRVAQKMRGDKDYDGEGLDWKSLMTFVIGLFAMTAIVSSTGGFLVQMVGWFQNFFLMFKDWPIMSDLGAGGICLLMAFLAWRRRDDSKHDLIYGGVCGFFFPMGGGGWAELTLHVGNWIPQIMQSPFN